MIWFRLWWLAVRNGLSAYDAVWTFCYTCKIAFVVWMNREAQ